MEASSTSVGVFPLPFIFLLVDIVLRVAPLLRLFVHPVMRPPSLDWRLTPELCGIAGVSLFSRSLGDFFFFNRTFSNPDNVVRRGGGWDAHLAFLKMALAFAISRDDRGGRMHVARVVEDGFGV